jgi:hypothetical protein
MINKNLCLVLIFKKGDDAYRRLTKENPKIEYNDKLRQL